MRIDHEVLHVISTSHFQLVLLHSFLSLHIRAKMKQRVTYIVKDAAEGFDPANLSIEKQSITVSALAGAREQHVTFGLHELPSEVTMRSLIQK